VEYLGLQLVTSLVDQLDGELELKRSNGMEFTIRFTVTKKDNLVQIGIKVTREWIRKFDSRDAIQTH
jgi:hypothetical protein